MAGRWLAPSRPVIPWSLLAVERITTLGGLTASQLADAPTCAEADGDGATPNNLKRE